MRGFEEVGADPMSRSLVCTKAVTFVDNLYKIDAIASNSCVNSLEVLLKNILTKFLEDSKHLCCIQTSRLSVNM